MNRRIIFCSNTSWYLFKFRRSTITRLLKEGREVYCMAPRDDYSKMLSDLGAEFVDIKMDGKSVNPLKEISVICEIYRAIKRIRPDYVFNFTPKMNLYSGVACRSMGVLYSNNISGLGTAFIHDSFIYRVARKLLGFSNKGAHRVFFQNEDDKCLFERLNLIRRQGVDILPGSGVNTDEFYFSPLPDGPIVFLMIARLIADKGVREYVAASQSVREKYPDIRCLLVGPMGVSNKTAIAEEEVVEWVRKGWIEYLGYQEDVRPLISQSHVVVLPSYREGMPRVVLEAASMGRPAIVTDAPGCRQSVEAGETGFHCQPQDAGDLARVMFEVVELDRKPLSLMGIAARRRVEKTFSEVYVINRALECVESVC
ncbi:glycosyltransferase family 4 protein [Hahella aquimaris]|uniref:glycosyltransferase family 4 protein n=1 Tax=Hahella sp. HNIBRBA332 TaxID=3015983 RepID=UPI00273C2C22|nr:glycosyltransferase family 4 protein [Hahella sp. HNIBRBA332]WLQ15464.1 glycosyltransferase family 4 protein [Hahella sp. HNIBRBA332]